MSKAFVTAYGDLYEVEDYNVEPDGYIRADAYRKVGNPEWHSIGGFEGGTLFVDAVDNAPEDALYGAAECFFPNCDCTTPCEADDEPTVGLAQPEPVVTVTIPASVYLGLTAKA
jgi:hypothetical protein